MKKFSMENFKMDQNSNILVFGICVMTYWLETEKVILKWYSGAPNAHFWHMAHAQDSAEFWSFLLVFVYLDPWGGFDGISWFSFFPRNHMRHQNMPHRSLRAAKIRILMLRHIVMDVSLLEMNQFFVILHEFWW